MRGKAKNMKKRYLGIIVLCLLAGILTGYFGKTWSHAGLNIRGMDLLRHNYHWVSGGILVFTMILLETGIRRLGKLSGILAKAEDEKADSLETAFRKCMNETQIGMIVLGLLSIVLTGAVFESESLKVWLEAQEGNTALILLLAGTVLMIVQIIYTAMGNVRLYKIMDAVYPGRMADPTAIDPSRQEYEALDEAQQLHAGKASYDSFYFAVNIILPVLFGISVFTHMMWNTGIFAPVMLGTAEAALLIRFACTKTDTIL